MPEPAELDQSAPALVAAAPHGASSTAWPLTSMSTPGPPMPSAGTRGADDHLDPGAPSTITCRTCDVAGEPSGDHAVDLLAGQGLTVRGTPVGGGREARPLGGGRGHRVADEQDEADLEDPEEQRDQDDEHQDDVDDGRSALGAGRAHRPVSGRC